MPVVYPEFLYRAIINYTSANGGQATNIMHFQGVDGEPVAGQLNAIALALGDATADTSWTKVWKESACSAWTLDTITVADLNSEIVAINNVDVVGTHTTSCLPPQVSCAVSWSVLARYRGGHPRSYLVGIPQSAQAFDDIAQLTSEYATTLETAASLFANTWSPYDILTDQPIQFCCLNTRTPHSADAPSITPIIDATVSTRLDSQRRRSGREYRFTRETT